MAREADVINGIDFTWVVTQTLSLDPRLQQDSRVMNQLRAVCWPAFCTEGKDFSGEEIPGSALTSQVEGTQRRLLSQ